MPKSTKWFKTLSEIVISTRRRAGARELDEEDLKREVAEWDRVCEPIPEDRLSECYYRALRERTVRAALQPGELYQLSVRIVEEMRESRREHYEPLKAPEESCYYCEGTGWQTVAYIAESGNENTGVRACACSSAPIGVRKFEPLREPQWRKRKHSVIWERVT
jgi:hypothetical protein